MYSIESFKKKVNMLHIELSDKQYNQYVTYYEMVVEKNKVMNLTGITEFDEFIDKLLSAFLCDDSIIKYKCHRNVREKNKIQGISA